MSPFLKFFRPSDHFGPPPHLNIGAHGIFRFSTEKIFSCDKISNVAKCCQKIFFQFSKLCFSSKNFELENFSNIKIDVKFYRESISGIYLGIREVSVAQNGHNNFSHCSEDLL